MTEEDGGAKRRSREASWVDALIPRLTDSLHDDPTLHVDAGVRLPYRNEIHSYEGEGCEPLATKRAGYQTDLLVWETIEGGWIPRVVIECKIGAVTTHDALTYSAKAATHKHVHPYLRYGILIGELYYVPPRLLHHGAHFDFMAAWPEEKASGAQWREFVNVLREEVRASRWLGKVMCGGTTGEHPTLIHRPLVVRET